MEQEKIKAYYQMWSEAWKLFRKWSMELKDDDSFWKKAVEEADAFIKQYKGQLSSRIIADILWELQSQAQTMKGTT